MKRGQGHRRIEAGRDDAAQAETAAEDAAPWLDGLDDKDGAEPGYEIEIGPPLRAENFARSEPRVTVDRSGRMGRANGVGPTYVSDYIGAHEKSVRNPRLRRAQWRHLWGDAIKSV